MVYDENMNELPFYFWTEKQDGAKDILRSFRKKFGLIGKLSQGVSYYEPKNMEANYFYNLDIFKKGLEPEDDSYFKELFEAIKKSVAEGKDYLLDLVKDNKSYLDPRIEY